MNKKDVLKEKGQLKAYKRVSPTTVEIDGEKYVKDYSTSFSYGEDIFERIKSVDDVLSCDKIENVSMPCCSSRRRSQLNAFAKLSILADVLNEGKERDENGFLFYVYYNQDHKEFFICEHTYSLRHSIYFASRKIAQYSIEIAREEWEKFYGISNEKSRQLDRSNPSPWER